MRVVIKIAICLMLLVLLTAEDCGLNYREQQSFESTENRMYQELEDNFMVNELDEEQLQIMEKRAVQKVQEFYQFLNIYADSGLDFQFRKQARQMARKAFISEENFQSFLMKYEWFEDTENCNLVNSAGEKIQFDSRLVKLENSFEVTGNGYECRIATHIQNKNIELRVFAVKAPKAFGNENLIVWELFLKE